MAKLSLYESFTSNSWMNAKKSLIEKKKLKEEITSDDFNVKLQNIIKQIRKTRDEFVKNGVEDIKKGNESEMMKNYLIDEINEL